MRIKTTMFSVPVSLATFCCTLGLFGLVLGTGCSSSSTEQGKEVSQSSPEVGVTNTQPGEKKPVEPAKPDYAKLWSTQVAKIETLIEADQLDQAEAELKALKQVYPASGLLGQEFVGANLPTETTTLEADPATPQPSKTPSPASAEDKPSPEQLKQYTELISRISAKRSELAAAERIEQLAAAKEAFQKQDYDAATTAVNRLLAISPTAEQTEQAQAIRVEIERIFGRQRELKTLVRMLGSEDKNNVRSAQSQLAAEPDVALSLLIDAVKSKDDPLLVRNALEMMRRMKRPDIALPAMVAVLANEEQKASWEDAVREISRMGEPGAGEPLLALVMSSKNPEQRTAALQSLVAVVDPPAETQVALLPMVMENGPELAQALRALHRSVRVHGTYDSAAGRNFDVEVSPAQASQLAELPARLEAIMAAPTDAGSSPEAAYEAKVLALATRRDEPQVLPVKVLGFSAEVEDGPAAAVLDGVWNSVDFTTQWRHVATERSSIVLDLGEERTVVGVRIWNFNEPSFPHRGWKEADIFVSDTPRPFDPVATGIVPMAPGAPDTPDYSTLIPVDFVRGRYVKLQAKSLWRPDVHTGLAEVQVIGF